MTPTPARLPLGTYVEKAHGASWRGHVCGYYSTSLTPVGYCIESTYEPGSVQIYPASALTTPDGGVFIRNREHETECCPRTGGKHIFFGWRDFHDGNGGEQVCKFCGMGAMEYSLRTSS